MAPNIAETLQDVVSGKEKPEDALLGKEGKLRLRGARFVQRQISEDVLPDLQSEGAHASRMLLRVRKL